MNDKVKSKLDTKIEAEELKDEELRDEELENVDGGPAYLKLGDIEGESLSKAKHDDWIEIRSFDPVVNRRYS